jgi:DNA gyrase subunit B
MLIYRITRAPERRIFKIFVGNIDDKDVEPYVQQIANKFKRSPVVDPKTGQIDLRYNQMANDQDFFIPVRDQAATNPIETLAGACISLDSRIPLLDGRTLALSEIINEWDNGNRNLWVYSCDPKTGEFTPGIITWAGVTRKNTEVMKITLDNGEEITTTPDHKFLHREGYKLECKDLKVGMSLMPFYRKNEVKYKKNNYEKDYEMIFDHSINDWVWTHKKVSKFHQNNLSKELIFNESKLNKNKNTIHHLNFNRFDNTPSNLVFMNFNDHLELHSKNTHLMTEAYVKKFNENPEFREKVKKNLEKGRNTFHSKRNSNPEYKEFIRNKQKESINKFFNELSVEELKKWCERINNPITKAKTTEKLLKWCENPDNLKLKIAICFSKNLFLCFREIFCFCKISKIVSLSK